MVAFTFTMRRHLIRLESGPFTSFRLAKFGSAPFADVCVQRLALEQNAQFTEAVRKFRSYLSRLWTKVHEILGQCRKSLVLSNAVARLSEYIKSRWRRKTEQCKSFWPPIFWDGGPRLFYGRLLARFTVRWLSLCRRSCPRLSTSTCYWSEIEHCKADHPKLTLKLFASEADWTFVSPPKTTLNIYDRSKLLKIGPSLGTICW